jgi:molybdopterin-guanine dinucleotide biosynthesis protein A
MVQRVKPVFSNPTMQSRFSPDLSSARRKCIIECGEEDDGNYRSDGRIVTPACIIAVGGYSGSGKTSLIEKALTELKKDGLYVGVLKQTGHHRLDLDREGKDTDRFFRAGAEIVLASDGHQGFARYPQKNVDLHDALSRFPSGLDLILIEGFRDSSVPGVWIEKGKRGKKDSARVTQSRTVLYRGEPGYLGRFLAYVNVTLQMSHTGRPLRAGLLIGGKSRRMGRPKGLLRVKGETLMEKTVATLLAVAGDTVLLGSGKVPSALEAVPSIPDAPGVTGPMAGMLGAFRWDPHSAWIISAVDMPLMEKNAWRWLLDQRRPGAWAVLPHLGDRRHVEATGGCYEPMIFDHIESLASRGKIRLQEIARHPKVLTPRVPDAIAHAWKNVNTPEEWE